MSEKALAALRRNLEDAAEDLVIAKRRAGQKSEARYVLITREDMWTLVELQTKLKNRMEISELDRSIVGEEHAIGPEFWPNEELLQALLSIKPIEFEDEA